jgi:hypothetical protein
MSKVTQKLELDQPISETQKRMSNVPTRMAGFDLNHRQRYATPEEIEWLRTTTGHISSEGLAIMLGAGPGVMTAAIKDGNPTIHVFMVDNDTCHYAIAHLRDYGPDYAQNVYAMVGDSAAVGTRYDGRQADLLVIDADHSEKGVRDDIICWLSHVKPGGYIMIHDYDASGTWFENQEQYPGVKLAADSLLKRYKVLGRVGTSMVYINELEEVDERLY